MKIIILLLMTMNLISCSIKSDEQDETGTINRIEPLRSNVDSDGDFMNDKEESDKGRNPFVADIPNIRVRFLQNYKIDVLYKSLETGEERSFTLDTKIGANDPTFKYRVGDVFLRSNSYKNASTIGKFSSHSWGDYQPNDLTWIQYPEIDNRFYQANVIKYRKIFDVEKYEILNVSVELENSIKLKANTEFKQIKNINASYRFYNYETESYEVIHSEVIKRHFNSGVNEVFTIKLENINPRLISENFFQKGEFIISELTDYEIPSIKSTLKKLMSSISLKTVPVIYNTPLDTSVSYVSVVNKPSFSYVLQKLFDKNVTIENNKLVSINQFKNTLPDYTYLMELKKIDKKGNWFIFTNKLNKHYLDHKFTNKDVISLSYILGRDLAAQTEEKIFSYRENAETSDHFQIYPLGNIVPNSEVSLFIEPKKLYGEKIKHWTDTIRNQGCGGRRNCISIPFACDMSFNIFEPLSTDFSWSKEMKGEINRLFLVLNDSEYSIVKLIEEKKMKIDWIDNGISLNIKDINLIQELSNVEENVLSLKISALRESHFNGLKLVNMSGRASYSCPMHATNIAAGNKWPLSVESKDFSKWGGNVHWGNVIRGERKNLIQEFSIGVTSVISNFFN